MRTLFISLAVIAGLGCGTEPSPLTESRRDSLTSVTITGPADEAVIDSQRYVGAAVSADVTRVDFFIDGALQVSDTQPPFGFNWDTRLNTLPPTTHPMDHSYFFTNTSRYGDHHREVDYYTDATMICPAFCYQASTTDPLSVWFPKFVVALNQAVADGQKIILEVGVATDGTDPDGFLPVLDYFAAHPTLWNNVVRVEIADEPDWNRPTTNQACLFAKSQMTQRGLPLRPVSIIYLYDRPLPDAVNAPALDIVGLEAYRAPPGNADAYLDALALTQQLAAQAAQVPASKSILLVPQAYTRNGAWTQMDSLRELQVVPYLFALTDPRVIGFEGFSYDRMHGTRQNSFLKVVHKQIGERLLGVTIPQASNGRHTLRAIAYTATGASARHAIEVEVQNLAAPGDFNGDGKSDLLFQNSTSGATTIWYENGVTRLGGVFTEPGALPDPAWKVVAVADFNRDGRADVVYQHAGTNALQLAHFDGPRNLGVVALPPPPATEWKVIGAGDWNDDARPDLVFRSAVTGQLLIWFLADTTLLGSGATVPSGGGADATSVIEAVIDLGDDGTDLIVHRPDGAVEAWLFKNLQRTAIAPLGSLDPTWRVAAVGRYNAGESLDLMWQSGEGDLKAWFLEGLGVSGEATPVPASPVNGGWRVVGPR